MKVEKTIQKSVRRSGKGKNVAGDVNAAVTANVGESASSSVSGSRVVSRQRIVQRNGETVEETSHTSREEIPERGE